MNSSIDPEDRLIVALDGMTKEEAFSLISSLPGLRWVKVGLELFVSAGPEVLVDLREMGLRVFLDLKFHDIPATMAAACRKAARTGAELISVHACAGSNALSKAQTGALEGAVEAGVPVPTLLAVTVLTSWDEENLRDELVLDQSLEARVDWLAKLAKQSGIGGCVCSPLEVRALRRMHPKPFELVTPGVRHLGSDIGDQARVMSPSAALKAGASRLVIGRPITRANNPADEFRRFCEELLVTL